MWILRRASQGSNDADKHVYRLIIGEHLVGRKDCHIQVLNDQSVSRKHANITVYRSGDAHTCSSQASVKDVSKFGTFINDVKCKGSVELKDGDHITFGTQGSTYSLNYEPLVVFTSCLENSMKKILKTQVDNLGGYMVNEWQKECTHLVMDSLSFTVKVIYALVNCCPIVKPSYFHDLVERINKKSELPLGEEHLYMPPIKEDLIDPEKVSFQPSEVRKSLFAGKLFLFLEKKQYKRLHKAIALAGGTSLLKESGGVPEDDTLLAEKNTLVMSVDLKSEIPAEREMWLGHVGDILTSCHRRPIPETEVGLAILHVSLNEYCNPSLMHIPRITKHIVSKSRSTMEAMSQRANESQNISVLSVLEKKPIPWKTDTDLSKKLAARDVSAVLTSPETKKRSRDRSSSEPAVLLVSDTPLNESTSSDTKRRKLSPSASEVTHVSQSQHSPMDSDMLPSIKNRSNTNRQSKMSSPLKSEATGVNSPGQRSVTEQFSADNSTNSPLGRKQRREVIPKCEITYISLSQRSPKTEKLDEVSSDDAIPGDKKRRKLDKSEVTSHVSSQSRDSSSQVKVRDTPSPEIPFEGKRRKMPAGTTTTTTTTTSDVTHISQTQRSFAEELSTRRSPMKNTSQRKQHVTATTTSVSSTPASHGSSKREDLTENPSSDGGVEDLANSTILEFAKESVPKTRNPSIKVVKSESHASAFTEQFPKEPEEDDLTVPESDLDERAPDENQRNGLRGSGWISKHKSCNERSEMVQKSCITAVHKDSNDEIGTSDEASENSGRGAETRRSHKLSVLPGFISKQERRKIEQGQREAVVKEEDDLDVPRDVLCIEHVELIVPRKILNKDHLAPKQTHGDSTKLRNMKIFRKKNYVGSISGLPRIIGGSDLVAFSSRNKDVEDWFLEIQEMNRERDLEDQAADKLFEYEPRKRKNH